jgi:hypothetical protein
VHGEFEAGNGKLRCECNLISGYSLRSSLSRNSTFPVEAHLEVNILGDLVEQNIENDVGFGDTEHATSHARVDVNTLPARRHERQGVRFR